MKANFVFLSTFGVAATAGCDSSEPATSDPFACVGSITAASPTQPSISVTATLKGYPMGDAVSGVKSSACALSDLTCATPLATTMSDANGEVTLSVPTGTKGFDGYVKTELDGYVTKLQMSNPPVAAPTDKVQSLMIPKMAWSMFLAAASVTEDTTLGHVALIAQDCSGNAVAGVSFDLTTKDASTVLRYVDSMGAVRSGATATDDSGRAIFLNVPTGATSIKGTIASSSASLGSTPAVVQAGIVTGIQFPPLR